MAYEQTLSTLTQLTPAELQSGCAQSRPDNAHEPFCFELFRRAIFERSEVCWAAVYAQYQKLVYGWTLQFARHKDGVGNTTVEELVSDAFTAFWRAYTPVKLDQAERLNSVLSYLKSCAATAVLQARRKAEKEVQHADWDELVVDRQTAGSQTATRPEVALLQQTGADQLWTIVERCCLDEHDRLLARLNLVTNLKPRAILEQHPALFADIAEIYTRLRNLKNRLARDAQMRELWGEFEA
ncbi:MAG: hypothetical protein M3Q45_04765 [Chloroflexota bacterium]|nr:hypothetical protein [Chloroflexota bacterium]